MQKVNYYCDVCENPTIKSNLNVVVGREDSGTGMEDDYKNIDLCTEHLSEALLYIIKYADKRSDKDHSGTYYGKALCDWVLERKSKQKRN